MDAELGEKLKHGGPVTFTPEEERYLRELLRAAMATTLECTPETIGDDARVFDELGLDSIDVFDLLDQVSERLDVAMPLESLPPEFIRGNPQTTFLAFAEEILDFFRRGAGEAQTTR